MGADSTQIIILGAARPFKGEEPSAMVHIPFGHRRVLDWSMQAFAALPNPTFEFVGGYKLEEVKRHYPEIGFSENPHWQSEKAASSLKHAALQAGKPAYIYYADTVFSEEVVAGIARKAVAGGSVLAIDAQWKTRYAHRDTADIQTAEKVAGSNGNLRIGRDVTVEEATGELVGVFYLNASVVDTIIEWRAQPDKSELFTGDIPTLLMALTKAGHPFDVAPIGAGRWAELNAGEDLARFVFGTKAETLDRMAQVVTRSHIHPQYRVGMDAWQASPETVCADIEQSFAGAPLAVRSSAKAEDSWVTSNAGHFTSLLNVPSNNHAALAEAINEVYQSYGNACGSEHVLVQEMLSDVAMSGVVFTRTLTEAGPYYVINYDDSSSRTDSVTAGDAAGLRTAFIARAANEVQVPKHLRGIWAAVKELETLSGVSAIDVEFIVDSSQQVHVVQLRPIAAHQGKALVDEHAVAALLSDAASHYQANIDTSPLFGIMPDWNPAEIIGTKPRALALSLYQHLITDEIWAQQRAEYGYRDLRGTPLIHAIAGHAYVDVAASFASFIPAAIDDDTADRLVQHYIKMLRSNPALHDKIEFDIALTCWDADLEERAHKRLEGSGLSANEIQAFCAALTAITHDGMQRVEKDLLEVEKLTESFTRVVGASASAIDKASALFEDCKKYGTLPFAHLARAGFVAMSQLKAWVRVGVLNDTDVASFLASLHTVTRHFEEDGAAVHNGTMQWDALVEKYGHLRPGTYDITSMAYAEDPEHFLRATVRPLHSEIREAAFSEGAASRMQEALHHAGIAMDMEAYIAFLRNAIQGREYAKFMFTRHLSKGLEYILEHGVQHGLGRDALSHVSWGALLAADSPEALAAAAEAGCSQHAISSGVELPPLISDADQFFCFERPSSEPNYVGSKTIAANVFALPDSGTADAQSLRGSIVLIPRADPGFDWLFGHDIAGLITQYGGANSHMAIRAAELGLPAAIGVGDGLFEELLRARQLLLDCSARKMEVLA